MYECSDCEKTFANKSNYNRHVARLHPKESEDEEIDHSDDESMTTDEEVDSDDSESSEDEDETRIDIWDKLIEECQESGLSIGDAYKERILFLRAMKKDRVHDSVMQTLHRVRDEEDMDFEEALEYAIEKRRYLIQRRVKISEDKMKE